MAYGTKQAILEEAGFSHPVTGEVLSGLSNAANKVFTTERKPLADTDYDDRVTVTDVTAYVDGSPVTVASVNAKTGAITLQAAPATEAVVTADYRYCVMPDAYVEQVRQEAADMISDAFEQVGLDLADHAPATATLRKIERWYAAGALLLKDYGFQAETDQTSKDGDYKMKRAEGWIDKLVANAVMLSETSATGADTASSEHEPDVFSTWDATEKRYDPRKSEEYFMRDRRLDLE